MPSRDLPRRKSYMRIAEASEYTGVPIPTLRHYRAVKKGPVSALIAGKVAYRIEDLDKWLDALFVAGAAEYDAS